MNKKSKFSSLAAYSVIDRDSLLFGHKKAGFIKHDISDNLVMATEPVDIVSFLKEKNNPDDWVIFRTRAIDAGGLDKTGELYHGPNDNGDYFSEEELLAEGEDGKRAFESFINCPLFSNHKNDDVEQSRGKILNAFYDLDNHCVYIDGAVDGKSYPQLARGIKENYINDTSMGASVKYSICSICGNKAVSDKDFCDHVRNHKGKTINGKRVYEKNYGIKFIENSFVTDGACENCTIQNVYSGSELLKKIENFLNSNQTEQISLKTASLKKTFENDTIKTARAEDIEMLNNALDMLKQVANQILNSREVAYDFLEDIGSLLAELQDLIVDLVEFGFANEQPGENGNQSEEQPEQQDENPPATNPFPSPEPAPNPAPMPAQAEMPAAAASGTQLQPHACSCSTNPKLGEIKSIFAFLNNELSKRGVDKMSTNKSSQSRKSAFNAISEKFAKILDMKKEALVVEDGPYSIRFNDTGIEGFHDGKLVASLSSKDLGEDMFAMAKTTPQVVAGRLIQMIATKTNENGEKIMANSMSKEALQKENTEVDKITELQLDGLSNSFERKDKDVDVVTENQLDNVPKSYSSEKGDFNRTESDLEVGERQLKEKHEGKDVMEVFEGQLEKNTLQSRHSAKDDLQVTQIQLDERSRLEKDQHNVTERQLRERRATPDTVINAVLNGMSNLVVSHKISPKTIAASLVKASNIGKSNGIEKKAQYTKEEINQGIENAIALELGEDIEDSQEFMEDALEVMFSDQDILATEVEKSANAKINEIKLAMATATQTVEAQKKSTIASIWQQKTARLSITKALEDIPLTDTKNASEESLIQALKAAGVREGKFTNEQLHNCSFKIERSGDVVTLHCDQKPNSMHSQETQAIGEGDDMGNNTLSASVVEKLQKLAEMKKEAQNPAGTTMPPATPPDMGAGAPPTGGVESLGTPPEADPMMDMGAEDAMDDMPEEGTGEAKPFGAVCPVCGSTDVDAVNGKFKCHECDAEYEMEINWNLINPEKFTDIKLEDSGANDENDEETEGEEINDQINSSPAALPAPGAEQAGGEAGAGGGMPPMGAHSNAWLKEAALRFRITLPASKFVPMSKTASKVKPIGSYCPQCGGVRVAMQNDNGICTECGCKTHVKASKNGHKVNVLMTWQPNITLAKKENKFPGGESAGYAVTANCEDCTDLNAYLHQILSSRKSLVRMASMAATSNPMIACMADQTANGYSEDTANIVCASIKEYVMRKQAMKKQSLLTDDDEDYSDDTDEEVDEIEDDVETVEDDVEEVDEDLEEVESDEAVEDDVEFEGEDDIDAEEDTVDFDDVEELDEETGEFAPIEINPEDISSIVLKGTDATGQEFEVEIGNGEVAESEEEFEFEPENMDEAEEGTLEDIEEDVDNIQDEAADVEEDVEDLEGEDVEDDDVMKGLFSDGLPDFGDDEEEDDEEVDEDPEDGPSITASEMLRSNRLASSNSSFGLNLDFVKLSSSMPLDTETEVPRDKSYNLKEKADDNKAKNTAKNNLKGTAAGTSFKENEEMKGTKREVQVITAAMKKIAKLTPEQEAKFNEIVGSMSTKERFNYLHVLTDRLSSDVMAEDQDDNFINPNQAYTEDTVEEDLDNLGDDTEEFEEDVENFEGETEGNGFESVDRHESKHEFDGDFYGGDMDEIEASSIKIKKVAQQTGLKQSEPIDAVEEDKDIDIPRNPSKAKPTINVKRKDVVNPDEIRTKEYVKGPESVNLHNDAIVPRDNSGDGLGGKKPKFDTLEEATSGNPDTYVQKFTESPKPTNKLSSVEKAIKKIAKIQKVSEKDLQGEQFEKYIIVSNLKNGKVYKLALK